MRPQQVRFRHVVKYAPSRRAARFSSPNMLIWRHFGAIITFMPVYVLEKRPRQSLRLDPHLWEEIDRDRSKRAGSVSRNTWITEAILEKLSREGVSDAQKQARFPHA